MKKKRALSPKNNNSIDWLDIRKKWTEGVISKAFVVTASTIAATGLVGAAFFISQGHVIKFFGGITKDEFESRLQQIQLTAQSSVPPGAVLIFDDANGCPPGWINLGEKEANIFAGRAIIAVGRQDGQKKKEYRHPGGQESILLNISQLPSHSHKSLGHEKTIRVPGGGVDLFKIEVLKSKDDLVKVLVPDDSCVNCKERIVSIPSQSSQSAVELMPPYLPLYFCKVIADATGSIRLGVTKP